MKNKTVDSKETFINEMRKLCKKYKIRECACSAILHSDNENRPINLDWELAMLFNKDDWEEYQVPKSKNGIGFGM